MIVAVTAGAAFALGAGLFVALCVLAFVVGKVLHWGTSPTPPRPPDVAAPTPPPYTGPDRRTPSEQFADNVAHHVAAAQAPPEAPDFLPADLPASDAPPLPVFMCSNWESHPAHGWQVSGLHFRCTGRG